MMGDYLVERLRALHRERNVRLSEIRSRKAAEAYRDEVRRKILRAFGPRPARTPLNAKVTGLVEEPGLRIEKLVFESRPGCLVTANLYLPTGVREPMPGVVGSCGHSHDGKAAANYQAFCRELAAAGFITLIFDPFNQGERDQYYGMSPNPSARGGPVQAHCNIGKQLELIGESFASWRAWDGIRALDYLLSRPEVDPQRVGVTGNSGGGTMSTWLWAIEDRFTMAAPSCFLTTFLANLENELPQDSEQYPHGILGMGLEMGDFMIARAPRPAILIGQRYCFFDHRGLADTYREVHRIYRLLGAEDCVDHFLGTNNHGYYPDGRAAMTSFFSRHAGAGTGAGSISSQILKEDALWATPKGEVIAAGSRPVFELINERAHSLEQRRDKIRSQDALAKRLNKILSIPKRRGAPPYRVLRNDSREESVYARFAVETEPGIVAILRRRATADNQQFVLEPEPELTLYLPHLSAETDLADEPIAQRKDPPVYALDVRGLGESAPDNARRFFHPYLRDYMYHGFSIMLGESYLGRRTYDTLRTMDLLVDLGAKRIHLAGRGQGAIVALFAAVLHADTGNVTLKNAPKSFREWTCTPFVEWPAANCPLGILKEFDLPDCIRVLGKRVKSSAPWPPDMPERTLQ